MEQGSRLVWLGSRECVSERCWLAGAAWLANAAPSWPGWVSSGFEQPGGVEAVLRAVRVGEVDCVADCSCAGHVLQPAAV
jgi:hypothetical protein